VPSFLYRSAFQRTIDRFIKTYHLQKVYACLDDITVTGTIAAEHDKNLNCLLAAVTDCHLTLNKEKSQVFHDNIIKPGEYFCEYSHRRAAVSTLYSTYSNQK